MTKSVKKSDSRAPMTPLNPFAVTVAGLTQLFTRAQPVGLFFVAVASASAVYGLFGPSPDFAKDPSGKATEAMIRHALEAPLNVQLTWLLIMIIIALFVMVVTTMLHGIASYTALQISKDRDARLGEAFNAVLENFGRYFVLVFLMYIKIALWSLLFVVPGIIASYRYSFAGMLFFDEKRQLRSDQALQASSRLAKNGLLTIFASQFVFNVVTFFYAERLFGLASQAALYREYTTLDQSNSAKPPAHPLAWVALAVPIVLFVGLVVFGAFVTK